MNSELTELYDYDELRNQEDATMYVVHPSETTLVLGSTQSLDLLDPSHLGATPVRRRRGGGGLVLVRPDDLWIDWWIPVGDSRWRADVHESSRMVGRWWADVLKNYVTGVVEVHDGSLEGDAAYRLVCFAGRGPGEVFINERKAVGLTQWRVREGVFVSTVMHAHGSDEVVHYLRTVPDGLEEALLHERLTSLVGVDAETLVAEISRAGGTWRERAINL